MEPTVRAPTNADQFGRRNPDAQPTAALAARNDAEVAISAVLLRRRCGSVPYSSTQTGATEHRTHVHYRLARRLAALVLTTLLALSVGHVLFNAGLDQMSWGAATADTPAHLADIVQGELGETNGAGCNPPRRRRPDSIQLCAAGGGRRSGR